MLTALQTFSQIDDSVKVSVIDGDTVLIMSLNKGKIITSDLLKGDSCCYDAEYLNQKVIEQNTMMIYLNKMIEVGKVIKRLPFL